MSIYQVEQIVNTPETEYSYSSQGVVSRVITEDGEYKYHILLKPGTYFKDRYYEDDFFSYMLWFSEDELNLVNK